MKTPRDISGQDLARALRTLDCVVTRQTGSRPRIATLEIVGHHEVVPHHRPVKMGTYKRIFAQYFSASWQQYRQVVGTA